MFEKDLLSTVHTVCTVNSTTKMKHIYGTKTKKNALEDDERKMLTSFFSRAFKLFSRHTWPLPARNSR